MKEKREPVFYKMLEYKSNLLHICVDKSITGKVGSARTLCGLMPTVDTFRVATDKELNLKVCESCLAKQPVSKTATFETKAELVDEPVKGIII